MKPTPRGEEGKVVSTEKHPDREWTEARDIDDHTTKPILFGQGIHMTFESLHTPIIIAGLLLMLFLACSRIRSGQKFGNMTLHTKETALNDLADESRVLTVLIVNSTDLGFYWLDPDNHKVYLAKKLHSNVPPEKNMVAWTGTQLVYGSRVVGFFSLAPDGTHQHITEFDYIGQLARNGEQILRYRKCGPDETGDSFTMTPLDSFTEPPLICVPRRVEAEPGAWYIVRAIWNPYLPQADFIVSKRFGRGKNFRIEWSKLIQVAENGEQIEIKNLGQVYPGWLKNDIQSRPDGQAFYVHNDELETASIIDRQGTTLVDFATIEAQLPHLQRNRRFSWSPDSQKAVLLFEDCGQGSKKCNKVLVLATNNFTELTEIVTLPANHRFLDIIWSPDSTNVSLVTEIHQGREDPPRIYTINLTDQSTTEYIFPSRVILRNVQWLR